MKQMEPNEKLGVSPERLKQLFDLFLIFYAIPQEHKNVIWEEFEAFVVGYKFAKLEAFEK